MQWYGDVLTALDTGHRLRHPKQSRAQYNMSGWVRMARQGAAVLAMMTIMPACGAVAGDGIAEPLSASAGDVERGRVIVTGRDGNCLLCHPLPESGERFMGNLAPPLSGVGSRLTAAQLRLRIVDPQRLNPSSIMPSYHRTGGLNRVAAEYRGRPLLSGQQVEDVIAYLLTFK